MCWSVNKTSDDGCIFIVRTQVLPASHMDTHGTGVLAHSSQPEKGQDAVCVAERECVRGCCGCICMCRNMAKTSPGGVCEPERQPVFGIQRCVMTLMLIYVFMYI